ncbi:MAG TPA: hypothetical protein GXZ24_01605 [Firmicutes bacterium]|nr:hypothetical protein [Bacillota bacterium]
MAYSEYPRYNLPNENKWAVYFRSTLEKSASRRRQEWTTFADPRQQQIARELWQSFSGEIKCSFWGGYADAERVRIGVAPAELVAEEDRTGVSCAQVTGSFPPGVLTHRDFLGALMGLGIKRETLGDIVYSGEGHALVFLLPQLASFLEQNLVRIGRYTAQVEIIDPAGVETLLPVRQAKEIRGTVASMRVDAVAGLGFGLSRSRIAPLIKGEQIKLNYQVINQPSKSVKAGDHISLTGKGRVEVVDVLGKSRKGRIHLLLHRVR